jgi:hypothetical protein
MTMSDELPADELLAKLFEVVLDEARSNRRFAEKLVSALPAQVVARIETGRKKAVAKPAEPPMSLTRLMNREGEEALQAFLKVRNKLILRGIVDRQQIPVDPSVFDGDAKSVRDAIVAGVKSKIADRLAAAS